MRLIDLKILIPMTLATLLTTAHPSSFAQTHSTDPQIIITENSFFPKYDNRIKFNINQSHLTSAGLSYERLKLQSIYFGVEAAAFKQGVGVEAFGGYNFLLSPRDRMTPIGGLSYCKLKESDCLYLTTGVFYEHAFTDKFRLGANFKAFISGDLGFSLGIPCTFQMGEQKRWEFEVQPYGVHVENWLFSHNSIGIQASTSYRF